MLHVNIFCTQEHLARRERPDLGKLTAQGNHVLGVPVYLGDVVLRKLCLGMFCTEGIWVPMDISYLKNVVRRSIMSLVEICA